MSTPTVAEIDAHNRRHFLRQKGRIKMFSAADATIVVKTDSGIFQLCQIGFNSDGSFRCAWPYLAIREGMVAVIAFTKSESGETTFSFGDQSRFTSQLVKFSHHVSGIAQFSLTGRVRSDVRHDSFPLNGPMGRLFELQCFYPKAFKPLTRIKPQRLYLTLISEVPDNMALAIHAVWARKDDGPIVGRGNVGPVAAFYDKSTGQGGSNIYYAPPLSSPIKNHMIYLSAKMTPPPRGIDEPGVLFIGGFNMHEVQEHESTEGVVKSGLAAMYPSKLSEELRSRVTSIDLID